MLGGVSVVLVKKFPEIVSLVLVHLIHTVSLYYIHQVVHMKFGEALKENLVPEWASQYIKYDELKLIIDQVTV